MNDSMSVPDGWSFSGIEDFFKKIPVKKTYDGTMVSLTGKVPVLDQSEQGIYGYHDNEPTIVARTDSPVVTFANHTCTVRFMQSNFSVIQNVFPLKNNQDVSPYFLYQILKNSIPQEGYKGHWPKVKETYFLKPPLPEQQKIASILTSVDDVIEKTDAQISKLQDLKKAMMTELLTKGIGHIEFKDSPVGRIPKNWTTLTLGELTIESAFGPRFSSELYSEEGDIGCIRTTDFDDNWDVNYYTVPLTSLNISEFSNHILKNGDLLITRSGTCGMVDVYKEQVKSMIPGAFIIRFRLNNLVNPYLLRYLLMTNHFQEKIQLLASGGVQKNLSGTSLKTLIVPVPTIDEQKEIVDILNSINIRTAKASFKLLQTKTLKKAVANDLLTGKKRVNVN